ncbi:molybdopterin cofactor-binding domain-containing protein [Bradyrhizobium japonicum]|uniref:molybdopterin cofactor-binding domain-containing protein n=1 Tax=Bradyrhizobium japonicum TaxID=375 RepID=UPI0004B16889|nr:molybdopterin cofactor-binding domain-containing protein [Bradyrhizobium japonicum]
MAVPSASLDATQPASWIEIHADNTLLIRTGKCDFGQSSIYTAYRQIVAEELGVPFEAITTVVSGDTDRTPDGGATYWLLGYALNLRKAAAYTREAVLELAGQRFGVTRDQLSIADGVVSGGGNSVTYGQMVAGQDLRLTVPVGGELTGFGGLQVLGSPPLKAASAYTIVGKSYKNSMVRPKVSGETVWVGDVKLPGMLHARVVHPNTLGSKLIAAGEVDKTQFPGARVVVVGNLVAVVSDSEWEAVQAATQVAGNTKWTEWKGLPGHDRLLDHLRNDVNWGEIPSTRGPANRGDADVAAAKTHSGTYFMPFFKHAPIGPTVSVADVLSDGSVTVHTHSQNPQFLRRLIAKMLSKSEDAVVVRTYPGPGHFGRSNGGNAGSEDEAVLLSRELGRPVRVQWMRADDMQWSTQSSTSYAEISIGLDETGHMVSYRADHKGPPMQDDRPIGAILAGLPTIDPPSPTNPLPIHNAVMKVADRWLYRAVVNVAESGHGTYQIGQRESPIGVGLRDHSMRTPIQFQQNFPREAAITEAAAQAGADPLQFRIDHVSDERFKTILARLREESGWVTRKTPASGARAHGEDVVRGQGVSIMLRDNGYWACAAHVAVSPASGEVRVERLTIVVDLGIVVNPLQLRRQVQAGSLMGVSQALHEEVAFDESGITSVDWSGYPILTMVEIPELKVVLAPRPEFGIYGQGSESANALAAPAIASAFFDATGKPARRIPLRPEYVRAMLTS